MNDTKTAKGLDRLDAEGTQYKDLHGIFSFDISNLLREDDLDEYKPHPEEITWAADISTETELHGSDNVNILAQARAILRRTSVVSHMSEGGKFDIVDIVTKNYPGILLLPIRNQSDIDTICQNVESTDSAFWFSRKLYIDERVRMIADFENEINNLHMAELLLHSKEFKIDSIMLGIGRMSTNERILRGRINAYMERELTAMIKRQGETNYIKHVETFSLPLEIGARVKACTRFYNEFGGGCWRKNNVLLAGAGSAGITFYDTLSDNFLESIPGFYKKMLE